MENESKENNLIVSDFGEMQSQTKTKRKIYTTIEDNKQIFNLENSCDFKINDCKGEKIRVTDVLIKINEKPLEEPVINDETGEIIKDKEVSMVTILIDDNKKSYVTGSKIFTMQMINYVRMFGLDSIKEGLEIKIIEKAVRNSGNKALGFELV
jgi:hypothetical protein